MRMRTRKCAIVLSWRISKRLREVSEGWKIQRQAKEWEQINAFLLDEWQGAGSTGSPPETGAGSTWSPPEYGNGQNGPLLIGPYGCGHPILWLRLKGNG